MEDEIHCQRSFALATVVEGSGRSSGAETKKKVVARAAPTVTRPMVDRIFFHVNLSTAVELVCIVAAASLEDDAETAFWSSSWKEVRWCALL